MTAPASFWLTISRLPLVRWEGWWRQVVKAQMEGEDVHELGLCEGILEAVERRASGRSVARVRVRVGSLHRVVPDAFAQAFSMAAAGTVAEEALVDVVVVPAKTACGTCGSEVESEGPVEACPRCGGVDLKLTAGDELILESLEYGPDGSGA